MNTAPPPILWFRPAVRGQVKRAWAESAVFVAIGATLLGLLRTFDVDFGSVWLFAWGVGLLFVMAGPIWLTTRLSRLLGQERVLSIHADGVRWQDNSDFAVFWPWSDIADIAVEGPGPGTTPCRLLFVMPDASVARLPADYEDTPPESLVALLLELRQKALLGLPVKPRQRPNDVKGAGRGRGVH